MLRSLLIPFAFLIFSGNLYSQEKWKYIPKSSRQETIRATLKANGLPDLEGKWYWIGPFDNTENQGFEKEYPPEKEIDLTKKYAGKKGTIQWKELSKFPLGTVYDLKKLIPDSDDTVVYLYQEIELKGKILS